MRFCRYLIPIILGLTITGCSILEDYLQEEDEPSTTTTTSAMSPNPPSLQVRQGTDTLEGTMLASCWPDGAATLCRDFMPAANWFEQGDFLTLSDSQPLQLEFVEGRPPDGVTLSLYSEFPPSTLVETAELTPTYNVVFWQPSDIAAGDYYMMVFGWWEDATAESRYDSVYIIALRVE